MSLRILLVTTEFRPLLKVGGLADVSAELPTALARLGHDVKLLMPAIRGMPAGETVTKLPGIGRVATPGSDRDFALWMLDTPRFRRRDRLYDQHDGAPWPDDAERFDELARAATALADDRAGLGWRADVVHAHDWASGLVPLRMMLERVPSASVFTVHNLAHQGLFPLETLARLGLPPWLMHPDALEFWGRVSFIKGGLMFADRLTTVSPRYAREIQTAEFGEGLEGVLLSRARDLDGIVNGLDPEQWNPATDAALAEPYTASNISGKTRNKARLLQELGLDEGSVDAPLLAVVSRLAPQKGIDILLHALPALVQRGVRVAIIGTGDARLEQLLKDAVVRHPGRVAAHFSFDEARARRVYAGSDLLLMASRFEPCGLSQLIALRYGCIPVVHAIGGLADTISEVSADHGSGNGFCFHQPTADALLGALDRALELRSNPDAWTQLIQRAMRQRSDWKASAARYVASYRAAIRRRRFAL